MSEGGADDRWLISYADFITLLMVLLVVLYSMSQVDLGKYKDLAEGLRSAFSSGGQTMVVDPRIDLGSGVDDQESSSPIIIPGIPKTSINPSEVAGQLTDLLSSSNIGGMVSVQNNIEGVLISLSEKLLFIPGTAELQSEAYPVLDTVISMLHTLDNEIRVIGHTDTTLPTDLLYASNWELSIARAMTVVNYFQAAGIAPERLTASGRGEYSPIFPNDTPEHRSLNSRAEIIVIYEITSDAFDLDFFNDSNSDTTEILPPGD